jgi:hypothetical protein
MNMKRIILLTLAAATCLLAGCSRGQKFTIQGTLKDARFLSADSLRLEGEQLDKTVIAPVEDGSFVLHGKVKKASIGKVFTIGMGRRDSRFLILEKGTISFKDGRPYGTRLNDSTDAFTQRLNNLKKQFEDPDEQQKALENEFSAFVSRHKNDPCATYAILLGVNRMRPDFLLSLINSTSPAIQNDGDVHALREQLKKAQ